MVHVVGSVNLDYVARLEVLPRPGETVLGTVLEKHPGGKGANQALAARRAGADVRMIACIGDDEDGRLALENLALDGVDLSGVKRSDAVTGVAMIMIDGRGENAITVLPGANSTLSAALVEALLAPVTAGDVILLQQEVPQAATRAALARSRRAGAMSILNVAPVLPDTCNVALEADLVVANETEFERIAGVSPSTEAAERWCRSTGHGLALTLGAQGAILAGFGDTIHVRPPSIDPVDTVGAGDTFCGCLAAGFRARIAPEEALRMAVFASAQACLLKGAQAAIPWAKPDSAPYLTSPP